MDNIADFLSIIQEGNQEKIIALFENCNDVNFLKPLNYNQNYFNQMYDLICKFTDDNNDEFLIKSILFNKKNEINQFSHSLILNEISHNNQFLFNKILTLTPIVLDINDMSTGRFMTNSFNAFPNSYLVCLLDEISKQIKELNYHEKLDMIHYFLESTLDESIQKDEIITYFFNHDLKPYRGGSSFLKLALNTNLQSSTWHTIINHLFCDKENSFKAQQCFDYLKEMLKDNFTIINQERKKSINEYIQILSEKELLKNNIQLSEKRQKIKI